MEQLFLQFFHSLTTETITTWLSVLSLFVLAIIFIRIIRATQVNQTIDWHDMITAKGTNNVSLTKVIQLVGGTVASWIVIKMTIQEHLTWDIFSLYLAYCAGTEGFSKYLSAKYGFTPPTTPKNRQNKKRDNETI